VNSQDLVAETEKSEDQQGWLATFADLMSLLMCFFVLLLSFSELDVEKFKQIAGSMKTAFGVQREVQAERVPLGSSVIAQEFSAGIPEPTILDEVKQHSDEQDNLNLAVNTDVGEIAEELSGRDRKAKNDARSELQRNLQDLLEGQLNTGSFELDNQGQQLIIRIHEKGTFASGSGFLQPILIPTLQSIADLLKNIPGQIIVAGHSDNRGVSNELYADNLALSASRAIAVARVLKKHGALSNIHIEGLADSQPLVANDSAENRARNRRVEIQISQGRANNETLSITTIGENKDG
jgi:chemotaxis protein MotB